MNSPSTLCRSGGPCLIVCCGGSNKEEARLRTRVLNQKLSGLENDNPVMDR